MLVVNPKTYSNQNQPLVVKWTILITLLKKKYWVGQFLWTLKLQKWIWVKKVKLHRVLRRESINTIFCNLWIEQLILHHLSYQNKINTRCLLFRKWANKIKIKGQTIYYKLKEMKLQCISVKLNDLKWKNSAENHNVKLKSRLINNELFTCSCHITRL
jgi:hypothetical protein